MTGRGKNEHETDELVFAALAWFGFHAEEPQISALHRVIQERRQAGEDLASLRRKIAGADPELMHALAAVVSVPETYFFRQPEHFDLIADDLVPRFAGREVLRAWSAGCATGEEAYSLAACLLASAPSTARVEVLGTDLLARNIARARLAEYGGWSFRHSHGERYGIAPPARGETMQIRGRVRAAARFAAHNLLVPAAAGDGPFDLILCRNVLLYLRPDAAAKAVAGIAGSLTKGGVVLFGPLDVSAAPHGLQRIGRAELNAFERPAARSPARRPSQRPKSVRPGAPSSAALVDTHVRALSLTEHGDWRAAEQLLAGLHRAAPDYLPGLFEYAILCARSGRRERATVLMRDLADRLSRLEAAAPVPGPEELPAEYYRVAAAAFLADDEDRVAAAEEG